MRGLLWITGVLAALWGGYWWVGSSATEQAAVQWFADQQAQGYNARYETLGVQGFPNRFDLTVTGLHLADPARGLGWDSPFAQVFAMTWKPWHLIAALPGGQTFTLPDQNVTLDGTELRGSLLLVPGPDLALNEIVATGEALRLTSTAGWSLGADKAVLSTRQHPTPLNTHRLGLQISGLAPDPAFASAAGLPAQLDEVHLDALATFSAPIDRHSGETRPRLTQLTLTEAHLNWGGLKLSAQGNLAADATGFAAGQIDLRVEDWPALPQLLTAMGVISPDFAPTLAKGLAAFAKGDPQVLTLTLTAKDGRMSLGPFPLGPAPYWN